MEKVSKNEFAKSAIWRMLGSIAAKGVSFAISIILARIIAPEDYGIIAIAAVFINLSDIFIEGGFTTALIRKKEIDEYDYSSVFITSFAISAILYLILFFCSPFVAHYYEKDILDPLLKVIGIMFFIQALSCTRNVYVQRHMQFKYLSICNIIASIVSGVVGIICAYSGLGVWSLVIQQLLQQAIVTLLLYVKVRIKFKWGIKWKNLREIFTFSSGVMGASLLNYGSSYLSNLFIPKIYSVEDLGYSDKGSQLPMQISLYTFGAMSGVLLPTLASYQDDLESFKRIMRKVVAMTAFFILPMMVGMAIVSEELIVVLLTDKWLPALRIMQYACIYYIATPFMLININVFYSLGHKYMRIKTEIVRFVLIMLGLLIFPFLLHCSLNQFALVSAIIAVLSMIVTYCEVWRFTRYSLVEVFKDTWKQALSAVLMGAVVFSLHHFLPRLGLTNYILRLLICFSLGVISYFLLVWLFKAESFVELKNTLLSKFSKKKAAVETPNSEEQAQEENNEYSDE